MSEAFWDLGDQLPWAKGQNMQSWRVSSNQPTGTEHNNYFFLIAINETIYILHTCLFVSRYLHVGLCG